MATDDNLFEQERAFRRTATAEAAFSRQLSCLATDSMERSQMQRVAEWTESRMLFRRLMERSQLLGWICEADGYCIYLSSAWHRYTGSSDGVGIGWLNVIHPDDRVVTRRAFFDANDAQVEYEVEYRVQRADGSYSTATAHGVPHFDANQRYMGMLGITTGQPELRPAKTEDDEDEQSRPKLLSDREREVLSLFAEGYTAETAALSLGIAQGTVSIHSNHATTKLGALNRTHAFVLALRLNELELPAKSA
ncbi:LuxR C-terminal-related transcriptional regulator [Devosia riboflavina]